MGIAQINHKIIMHSFKNTQRIMKEKLDKQDGDITLQNKKKKIRIHETVLQQRCPSLLKEAVSGFLSSRRRIKLKNVSSHTITALAEYLYTAEITFDNLSPYDVLALCSLATIYNQDHLWYICSLHICSVLDDTNAPDFLKASANTNQNIIKDICMYYIICNDNRYRKLFANIEAIKKIGFELAKEITETHTWGELELQALTPIPCSLEKDVKNMNFNDIL